MARGNASTKTVDEADVEAIADDGNETVASTEGEKTEKAPKEKKEPARGELPEGYVTPVGFATELSKPLDGNAENLDDSNWRHSGKNGHAVAPQMVYSYLRNAGPESKNPFPIETVKDSLGHERQALKLEAGFAWWDEKNKRAADRKANAEAKATAKAEKAAKKDAEPTEAEASTEQAVEAE